MKKRKKDFYRIGSLKDMDARIYTNKRLAWSDGDKDMLGVTITNGEQTAHGFDITIDTVETICNKWS